MKSQIVYKNYTMFSHKAIFIKKQKLWIILIADKKKRVYIQPNL